MIRDVSIGDKKYRVEIDRAGGAWSCRIDGRALDVDAVFVNSDVISLRVGNHVYEVKRDFVAGAQRVWVGHEKFAVELRDPRSLRGRARAADEDGVKKLVAPMPGKVVRILLAPGAEVEAGTGIVVVEAMKMQNEVKSPKKGHLQKILVSEGAAVNAGDILAIVE